MEKISGTTSVFYTILHIVWKFQYDRTNNKENSKIFRRPLNFGIYNPLVTDSVKGIWRPLPIVKHDIL